MSATSACEVSLVRATSRKPCELGTSFGCEGTSMWISSGCRGKFVCQGNRVTCGFAGLVYSGLRHECTCAMWHEGGTYLASTGTAKLALPRGLIHDSAPQHPRLREARQGEPRFVPGSVNESLIATFAVWNLLDATMHELSPEQNYQTGYVRELQLRRMINLVRQPSVRVYCEIGFNGGHSAAAMLLANPGLLVHSFDLMAWRYSNRSQDLLKTMFGPRLTMHPGDSTLTVPAWTRRNPRECDVLFVDGDHTQSGARKDMVNMMWAAAPGAFAVADDINSDPGKALHALAKQGKLDVVESYGPFEAPSPHNPCMRTAKRGPYCAAWGFAVYTYPQSNGSKPGPNTMRTRDILKMARGTARAERGGGAG